MSNDDTIKRKGKSDKDPADARDMMKRDIPEGTTDPQWEESEDDRDKVYRPDENVDNQKSPKGQRTPGHNSSIKQTPHSGVQVKNKPKQEKNINEKSDDARSPRRNG